MEVGRFYNFIWLWKFLHEIHKMFSVPHSLGSGWIVYFLNSVHMSWILLDILTVVCDLLYGMLNPCGYLNRLGLCYIWFSVGFVSQSLKWKCVRWRWDHGNLVISWGVLIMSVQIKVHFWMADNFFSNFKLVQIKL